MTRQKLNQYVDACALIRDTEEDIRRNESKRGELVQSSVRGSSHDYPYTMQTYSSEGTAYRNKRDILDLELLELVLRERKAAAEEIRRDVEAWMNTIPQRMQRIIRYRIFEELPWAEVAERMGRRATAEGIRKEFEKFMKKI